MSKASLQVKITPYQVLYILLFLESIVIAIAIGKALARELSPAHYFGENGIVTDASCIQLLIASILALATFWKVKNSNIALAGNDWFWLLISLGLLFLAVDDAYEIHERIDLWLHDLLEIQQTNFTDLIDDLIVGGYLLLFIGCIATAWQSLQVFRPSFTFFQLAFALTIAMVILDMVGNNDYFLSLIIDDLGRVRTIEQWLSVVEDSIKIIAEGMFIAGIYHCWQIARSLAK